MQTANVNLPITVTGRHVSVTESMRAYATKKLEGLHLDYPRIIEAKVILDVEKNRQIAEIVLFCANHITIEASTETEDLYASIDETVSKIARRMRKHKTRLLKSHRPRNQTIRHLEEQVFSADLPEHEDEEPEPLIVHKENYRIRPMFRDEAIMEMEMSERTFLVFQNAKNNRLNIVFRRKDGDYGVIEPQLGGD
ncbi:MAG: ribosome-associated translation inhibitor RaiA [Verrucomicrobiota bacterium]